MKLDAHQLPLVSEEFNLQELLTEVRSTLQPVAAEARVHLRMVHPYVDDHLTAAPSTSASSSTSPSASTTPPAFICEGDVGRVRQVLLNLVSNAIKYSRPGYSVDVCIRHLLHRPASGLQPTNPAYHYHSPSAPAEAPSEDPTTFFLHVQVADAGCGISASRLAHIFASFSQGDSHQLTRRFDGAGLGLGLCAKLMDLMRGQLLVESKEGDGSVFHALLPLRWASDDFALLGELARWEPLPSPSLRPVADSPQQAGHGRRQTNINLGNDAADDPRSRSAPLPNRALCNLPSPTQSVLRSISGVSPGSRPRTLPSASVSVAPSQTVLIVDDNAVNLKVAARLLQKSGYVCVCAAGGREALEVVSSQHVDVVLMDLQMPNMDGLECTRQIRVLEAKAALFDDARRLPIIALTASAGADVEEMCRKAGMNGCMFKPCGREAMCDAIAQAVSTSHATVF